MSSAYETIIFDFDYTLADSSRGVIKCVNYALAELGFSTQTPERIRHTIGLSLPDALGALVGPGHQARAAEFAHLFIERADVIMADHTVIYPSVPEALASLNLTRNNFVFKLVVNLFSLKNATIRTCHSYPSLPNAMPHKDITKGHYKSYVPIRSDNVCYYSTWFDKSKEIPKKKKKSY